MKTNNFHDIWTVIKFTMRDMVSRKSFRISTIIVLVLIVLGFNLPNIINSISGEDTGNIILISDPEQVFGEEINELNNNTALIPGSTLIVERLEPNVISEKIANDDINSAVIISLKEPTNKSASDTIDIQYLVKNTATSNYFPNDILHALKDIYYFQQLKKHGFSEQEINQFAPPFQVGISQVEDQEIGGNIVVMMMLSCVLFFAIYFCALQVSSSITIEKTSKIIETLVTSTAPHTIVLGKTIGIGLVGLGQILLFAITAIICAKACLDPALLAQMFDLSNFTPYLAIITLIYFILGYFAYALLYALVGSTVAKPEDIQAAQMPVVLITMLGFYLTYFTLTDPTGELNIVASLLPISSPFCMPLRIMMGLASGWDVALSIIILLAFCYIVAKIAVKIYSNAILNYGSRMTISDMIKTYKEK